MSFCIQYKCYVAFIQSLMIYGFPSFCNAPQYLLNKFLRVERRAFKYFHMNDSPSFLAVADKMCKKLFDKIALEEHHSMRCMFESREPTLRDVSTLRAPFAKTVRFGNSFIKYAKL